MISPRLPTTMRITQIIASQVTSIDARELPPEVYERRHLVDAVLLGVAMVVDLDERDVQRVGLAVDLLQALQNLLAVGAVVSVWK